MTISGMLLTFCQYLIGLVFFIPAKLLYFSGLIFPSCSELGVVAFPAEYLNNAVQMIRTFLPFLQFLPIGNLWLFANVIVAYVILRWTIMHLPWLISFGAKTWSIIIFIYLVLGAVSWLTSNEWTNDPVFNSAFGGSPTSTWSGGGFGGGGGESW